MRKMVLLVLIALLCAAQSDVAFAKLRTGFIPIPGFQAAQIIKVLDLPDITALHRDDGVFVDLGYKFDALGGGQWVGYLDSPTSYLDFEPNELDMLLLTAGLDELPPIPSRPEGNGLITIAAVSVGCFGLLLIFARMFGGLFRRNSWTYDNLAYALEPQYDSTSYADNTTRMRTMTQHQQFIKPAEFGRRGL